MKFTCGNLTGGVDYVSGPYDVKFFEGDTRVHFCVNITDDDLLEGDETFGIEIKTTSLHLRVISKNHTVNITIVDNECKFM